jgi:Phosphotransferase enzyme family
MSTQVQLAHDLFRILLYRKQASELLFETSSEQLCLPTVGVPQHTRVAEQITSTMNRSWGVEAFCLFPLSRNIFSPDTIRYQVAEVGEPDREPPPGMQWCSLASLGPRDFQDNRDFAALESSLTALEQYRRGELPGPFGKPGWPQMVTHWVAAQAAPFGLRLNGRFRQFNASPTFSLIRFETNGPALWFKAVGEPNLPEYSITLRLAALFPTFVPHLIASQPGWNAWLSVEAKGAHLDSRAPEADWLSVAASLANLQLASFEHGLNLIEAGCKDARTCSLRILVDPFFDAMAELMAQQAKPAPPRLSRHEVSALADEIRAALEKLDSNPAPDALGHADFNPGNVLVSRNRCIFLDWAEGCVGHPFFTFQYLLEHLRRERGLNPGSETALLSAYSAPWQAFLAPRAIARNLSLIPLLAVFVYAAGSGSWRRPGSLPAPTAGYFRSLTRRMHREAKALWERRLPCVS